ncbi:hypothetical protein KU53_22490 [Salmonella enterica subsp. enterica]|nr:hypothetical protein [Salmonella enterica subsp. enterica]EAA7503299.1 hypothetical protein [Salmonella enterica subsp. enterica serovar Thompson]EAM9327623.1 hypothetical protein [Salmonella enterica]EBS3953064.1 hypothetical protein [Salmonella enterica subsp. enterica serovar Augustenborg]EBW8001311.1 hypothetical protein [Salmonella enterica subsp. enterica serovar Mgulani]EBX8483004.1 hypothetical protein [Salmonella enterica subsp. enterica serovar Kibusi]
MRFSFLKGIQRAYPIRAILLAILVLGSAQNPHVLRVRSGFCALSVSKLAAPITPGGIGPKTIIPGKKMPGLHQAFQQTRAIAKMQITL